MSFKLMHLVLCFVLALTAIFQDTEGIKNGLAICKNDSSFINSSCSNSKDSIDKRIESLGVDCCNKVVKESLDFFHDTASKIFRHLGSLKNDPQANFTVTSICTPNEDPAATLEKNHIKIMFTELSSTCQRYTDVVALKNQLQCHMFMANNTRSNVTLTITQSLIELQTAATKLQKIEGERNSSCVEFTASQYHHIYKSRFERDILNNLEKIAQHWGTSRGRCCNWNSYEQEISK